MSSDVEAKEDDLEHRFEYRSLRGQPPDTIRLLTVYPGESKTIVCQMSCAALSPFPIFKALSYMWGEEHPYKSILINGAKFLVRPNLWTILRRMQQRASCTVIWIDAICVNQEDLEERQHQVSLMSKIYGQAEVVIAWLGHTPHGVSAAESEFYSQEEFDPFTISSAAHDTLFELAHRNYWNRTWIIQEILLAREVLLWFGATGAIPYNVFVKWVRGNKVPFHLQAIASFGRAFEAGKSIGAPLGELINCFQDTQCLDPRDKVYAFLALSPPEWDDHGIVADYTKSATALHAHLVFLYGGRHAQSFADILGCDYDPILDSEDLYPLPWNRPGSAGQWRSLDSLGSSPC